MNAKLLQSCPTLCNHMDSSPPGSSVYRILWARIVEWVAISYIYTHTYLYIYEIAENYDKAINKRL